MRRFPISRRGVFVMYNICEARKRDQRNNWSPTHQFGAFLFFNFYVLYFWFSSMIDI